MLKKARSRVQENADFPIENAFMMWDTIWGIRNRKMPFFFGQDCKSAFVGGYKFTQSRAIFLSLLTSVLFERGFLPFLLDELR